MKDPRQQRDFACIHRITGDAAELAAMLKKMGDDVAKPEPIDFRRINTVHFMRWVVLPPREKGGASQLALSTNFDPPRERHLRQLIEVCGPVFHQIYRYCEGYPGDRAPTEKLIEYLVAKRVKSAAFYVGHAVRTRDQILEEARLREDLERTCDDGDRGGNSWHGLGARVVRARLRACLERRPGVAFMPEPVPPPGVRYWSALVFWILVALPVVLVFAPYLRFREWRDAQDNDRNRKTWFAAARDPAHRASLVDREDYVVQNQITHLVDIKPGLLRQISLRLTLAIVNMLARYYFNKGHLNHIPTIHFARWCIIDKGKRLLFFSNYDGSWESYLGDFIDQAAKGLTGVWSNTVGYPETRWLVWAGARDEEHFKNWTRAHQIPTQLWYSAYPNLSVRNVNHNTALRRGLVARPADDEELEQWIRLL